MKSQTKLEKEIKMNNGAIKYIFIVPSKLQLVEGKKIGRVSRIREKSKGVKIPEDRKLIKSKLVHEFHQNESKNSLKKNKKHQKLKRVRKRRKVTLFKKKNFTKYKSSTKKKGPQNEQLDE